MNIVITGASQGIGFETVKKLSSSGENHILAIARSAKKLESLLLATEKFPGTVHTLPFDVLEGSYEDVLYPILASAFKDVDVLINNAGQLINVPFILSAQADFEFMMQANFLSHIKMIRALVPFMEGRKAHIVNIGSMAGFQESDKFIGLSAYSASKAALMTLSECLAVELKDQLISVNSLALGSVQTDMFEKAFPSYQAALSTEEMADFIAYFACSGHAFFNGKILPVSKINP